MTADNVRELDSVGLSEEFVDYVPKAVKVQCRYNTRRLALIGAAGVAFIATACSASTTQQIVPPPPLRQSEPTNIPATPKKESQARPLVSSTPPNRRVTPTPTSPFSNSIVEIPPTRVPEQFWPVPNSDLILRRNDRLLLQHGTVNPEKCDFRNAGYTRMYGLVKTAVVILSFENGPFLYYELEQLTVPTAISDCYGVVLEKDPNSDTVHVKVPLDNGSWLYKYYADFGLVPDEYK